MRRRLLLLGLVAVACSSGSPATTSPGTSATASSPSSLTSTPPAVVQTTAPSPDSAGSLADCRAPQAESALEVMARPGGRPDDLVATPDGGLWISDTDGGVLRHLDSGGSVLQTIADPDTPEGLVLLDDGRLLVAEQRLNRVAVLTPPSTARSTLVPVSNRSGAMGIDGIGYVPASRTLLVPDSPDGTLVAVRLVKGAASRMLASGLGRPVGAAAGSDGRLYVVNEGTSGLWRVPPDGGTAVRVGSVSDLDDVVAADGMLYVTALAAHAVVAVDPATGASRTLVTGVGEPQGLALVRDRLVVADSTSGTIVVVPRCVATAASPGA